MSDAEREAAIRAEHKPDPRYGNAAVPTLLRQLDAARAEIADVIEQLRNTRADNTDYRDESTRLEEILAAEHDRRTAAEARVAVLGQEFRDVSEACDEAEARVAVLEAALHPFAEYAKHIAVDHPGWDHDGFNFQLGSRPASEHDMTMRSFRAARAALATDLPR